jgi:predicted metalloendopeptidase
VNDPKTGKPAYQNGKLTLGENIGDKRRCSGRLQGADEHPARASRMSPSTGFTAQQRFFLGYAQV